MRFIYVVILSGLVTFLQAQNPASVPLAHPVYNYFERLETLGIVDHLFDGVKPYSRYKISQILKRVTQKRDQLTAIDQRLLQDFLLDFRTELQSGDKHERIPHGQNWYSTLSSWDNLKKDFKTALRQKYPEEENHLFMWEDSTNNFYFDYQQLFTFDSRSDNVSRSANEQSYIFRGTLNGKFSYQAHISLQGVRGDDGYRELDPITKNTFAQDSEDGSVTFLDRTGGELAWHTAYMDIRFAQQELKWGHGKSGNLILSNHPEQYPYVQISREWAWGSFTAMHGKLQSVESSQLDDGSKIYPDKWVAAHRLEIAPWSNFTLSLNEVFIYGNRYADWAYVLPFNFYRAVQHKLRDRDNATISLDFEYIPVNGLKWYTTIFLDEMKFEKLGTDWWGNKHALQSGLQFVDFFGLPNTAFTLEYTAIMPWVYTHKYGINRYESDGRSIGHWAGPNAEVAFAELSHMFHPRLLVNLSYRRLKKGANTANQNVGGDLLAGRTILLGNQQEAKETRRFLEGDLTTEERLAVDARYEIFNDLYLSASYIAYTTENKNNQKRLNEIHFGFLFNY